MESDVFRFGARGTGRPAVNARGHDRAIERAVGRAIARHHRGPARVAIDRSTSELLRCDMCLHDPYLWFAHPGLDRRETLQRSASESRNPGVTALCRETSCCHKTW